MLVEMCQITGEGLFEFNLPDQEFDFGDGKPSEMAQVVNTYIRNSN